MKKKLFFVLLTCAICFIGCKNNDRLIDKYEQAMQEENYDEAAQILSEIDEDDLTYEQQMRILDIATGGAASSLTNASLKSIHQLGESLNEEITDERVDKSMEMASKVIEEAGDMYDEALDDLFDE